MLGALVAYQNEHGGFGQALEPDKRCQPAGALVALEILDETCFEANMQALALAL